MSYGRGKPLLGGAWPGQRLVASTPPLAHPSGSTWAHGADYIPLISTQLPTILSSTELSRFLYSKLLCKGKYLTAFFNNKNGWLLYRKYLINLVPKYPEKIIMLKFYSMKIIFDFPIIWLTRSGTQSNYLGNPECVRNHHVSGNVTAFENVHTHQWSQADHSGLSRQPSLEAPTPQPSPSSDLQWGRAHLRRNLLGHL